MSEVSRDGHQPKAETSTQGFVPDPSFITYDLPKGGLNPFDVEEPATQHLFKVVGALTGGARYSRAWIGSKDPDDKTDTADRDASNEAYYGMPAARATQDLWEKLAVIHQGRLIAAWPETKMPLYRFRGVTSHLSPYCVLDSTLSARRWEGQSLYHDDPTPPPYGHRSYAQALTAALELTDEYGRTTAWTSETVMVARLLGATSLY
jgi:hypothetical protein